MRKMSKRGQLVIYSGPSGVGKGTLLGPLLATEPGLVLSVSATTALPAKGRWTEFTITLSAGRNLSA